MAANNFNRDEFVQPPWMNESFFAKALGKFEHDPNLKVTSLDFKPETLVGDHFASVMYRVTAEYDIPKYKKCNEKRVMIVKTVPFMEGMKAYMINNSTLFKTEMRMYSQVLPEMERLLSAAGDNTKFCPRLIYQSNEPAPVIILEDISQSGFEMTPKLVDYDTLLNIASVLGKFHATSIYIQQNGHDLTNFTDCFVLSNVPGTNNSFIEAVVVPGFDIVLEELKSWENSELIVEKFIKMKETFVKKMKNAYYGKNDMIYSVLTHCDLHYNDIMFKNNKKDMLLLDYQCCFWGSPAVDLTCLLYMIGNFEARQRRTEVIKHYYEEFSSTLKKIGFLGKIPTLHDVNMELLKNGILEVFHVFSMVLWQFVDFSTVDPEELFKLDQDQTAMHRLLMKNPEYQKILKAEIPRLIHLGIMA